MGARQNKKWSVKRLQDAAFCRLAVLCLLSAFGIVIGVIAANQLSANNTSELKRYLEAYMVAPDPSNRFLFAVETVVTYLRGMAGLLLLSFCTIGMYLIPIFCGVTGFTLAFSVSMFWACFSQGLLPTITLFILRALLVLPTMLYFGSAAMLSSVRGKSGRGVDYWRGFGLCVCLLIFGIILECTMLPSIFEVVYSRYS